MQIFTRSTNKLNVIPYRYTFTRKCFPKSLRSWTLVRRSRDWNEKSFLKRSQRTVLALSTLNETANDSFKISGVSIFQYHLLPSREWIDTKGKWKRDDQELRLTKAERNSISAGSWSLRGYFFKLFHTDLFYPFVVIRYILHIICF